MSDQQVLAPQEEPKALTPTSPFELLAALARDPSVQPGTIRELAETVMGLEKWADERRAEREFIAAFSRLKFPPIKKTAKGHNSNYAPYEEIQEIIDPILAAEGFTLTFTSGEPTPQGIPVYGRLSHTAGHSQQGMLTLPRDKSGSMNDIQGAGSTVSYGQRYVAKMMLNLRFIGDDDDAQKLSFVDDLAISNITNMIAATEMNASEIAKFLKFMNVDKISEIRQANYAKAMTALQAKLKRKQEGQR